MRVIPIEVELNWPIPNYVDPPTRGMAPVIVNVVMITIVTVTVLLRLYTRMSVLRWFGLDDLFIVFALISTIGMTVAVILANLDYGWDRHVWDLRPDQWGPAMKMAFAAKCIFSSAATFTRLSLIAFYYRLVKDSSMRRFRWFLHGLTFATAATLPTFVLLTVFQCSPIRAYWTYPILPNQRCISEGKATLYCGIVLTILDLITTTAPIPLIIRLQLPWRRRIGAIVLISLGLIVTVAGAVRTYYSWKALLQSYDQTWYSYGIWLSAAVEVDLGVMCACAPALRLLFSKGGISQNLSSFGSYISRRAGGSKLSTLFSSIPSLKHRRRKRRSVRLPEGKELDDSMFTGGSLNAHGHSRTPSYLWEEPFSGEHSSKAPIGAKGRASRISTVIPSGMMSPVKYDGNSIEMVGKGLGTTTTVTTGPISTIEEHTETVEQPSNWPLMTVEEEEQQKEAVASIRKQTGFNFNVEHQPGLGVLEENVPEEEEEESEGELNKHQSVEVRELPAYSEQGDLEASRTSLEEVNRGIDARRHLPSSSTDRPVRLRSDSDIAKERTRRWREKQQKQAGYGWAL